MRVSHDLPVIVKQRDRRRNEHRHAMKTSTDLSNIWHREEAVCACQLVRVCLDSIRRGLQQRKHSKSVLSGNVSTHTAAGHTDHTYKASINSVCVVSQQFRFFQMVRLSLGNPQMGAMVLCVSMKEFIILLHVECCMLIIGMCWANLKIFTHYMLQPDWSWRLLLWLIF